MEKLKILNFQDINFLNTETSHKPFDETILDDSDIFTVVIIRDPYEYFDQYLEYCIFNEMSPKLKKETQKAIKRLDGISFLKWFETLHYLPLVNPQTFQLDMRKRVNIAIENLESFDYVVPYEALDTFVENVAPDLKIKKQESKHLSFSLSNLKEYNTTDSLIKKDKVLTRKVWSCGSPLKITTLNLSTLSRKKVNQHVLFVGMRGWLEYSIHILLLDGS